MHVEDVVRGDRRALRQPSGLRPDMSVGDESERGAAAAGAVDLEEQEVVPAGQQPDPIGSDGFVADGAADPVEERAEVILRTHPSGV